jgi:hypothetical protein
MNAVNDCASLSSVDGLAGLIGTHDDTSRQIAAVAMVGGEIDIIVDETCSAAALPLDKVRVLSLGSLVSSNDATCLGCSTHVEFLNVVDSTFLADVEIMVADDRCLGRNGC